MAKKTVSDPKKATKKISNIIDDKFKAIKNTFKINLFSVLNKSVDRAIDIGSQIKPSAKAKKVVVKNRLKALTDVMLGDIDSIKDKTSQNMARDVANSYAKGSGVGSIKKQLLDNFGKTDGQVQTVIRTNTAYLGSLSKLIAWQEQGFTHYKWIVGKWDAKTRKKHKEWHNKEFSIADGLSGKSPIPGHVMENGKINLSQSINCRCGVKLSR